MFSPLFNSMVVECIVFHSIKSMEDTFFQFYCSRKKSLHRNLFLRTNQTEGDWNRQPGSGLKTMGTR